MSCFEVRSVGCIKGLYVVELVCICSLLFQRRQHHCYSSNDNSSIHHEGRASLLLTASSICGRCSISRRARSPVLSIQPSSSTHSFILPCYRHHHRRFTNVTSSKTSKIFCQQSSILCSTGICTHRTCSTHHKVISIFLTTAHVDGFFIFSRPIPQDS